MSRRHRAVKRESVPDGKFQSTLIQKLINLVMERGKKSVATTIVYRALDLFSKKIEKGDVAEQDLSILRDKFDQALQNASPLLEVKSRRIGGANYQVPIETTPVRRTSLALRWIIGNAKKKKGKPMYIKLAEELADCYNGTGTTIKKRDDTHRMAEANKAFAHYRW